MIHVIVYLPLKRYTKSPHSPHKVYCRLHGGTPGTDSLDAFLTALSIPYLQYFIDILSFSTIFKGWT